MSKNPLFAMLATVLLASAVYAGPLEDAKAARTKGDYATALRLFRQLAEQGNADGQYNLGGMYESGQGVPQDYGEAVKWYQLSAAQGHADCQYALGAMYFLGRGVPKSFGEAVKWYRLAAAQGHVNAQKWLGLMYFSGQGVSRDKIEAYKWYSLAGDTAFRDSVAKELTDAQLAEAKKRVKEWKPSK